MRTSYEILIDKLDKFIRRYYLNLLIKGSLFFAAGFLLLLLSISVLEYFGYFTSNIRFVLFYGFTVFNAFVFIRYVLIPLLGLIRIGRRVGAEEAGRILGVFFREEISDKVTNTLQLKKYLDQDESRSDIIAAAIEQKASAAGLVPFQKAIDLRGNLRFAPFFIVPLLIALVIYTIIPELLTQPVQRIIQYDTHFEKPSPFSFHVDGTLSGFRNENLLVDLYTEGSVMPSQAEIHYQNKRFRLDRESNGTFGYTFRNLQDDFTFYIQSEGFRFGPFDVMVMQKPALSHFSLHIQPPAYTRLDNENFLNIGDITVAEGSTVTWDFNTGGSGYIEYHVNGEQLEVDAADDRSYKVQIMAIESFGYRVFVKNEQVGKGDSISYFVQVRKDQYPGIQVERMQDSVMAAHLFHRGIIQDDYGFQRLNFSYRITDHDLQIANDTQAYLVEPIEINTSLLNQTFFHHLDVRTLNIKPGEQIEYFYTVYDNDGINGPKATRSRLFTFAVPGREELIARARQDEERIRDELSGGIGEVQDARDELEQLRRQMLESDRMSWQQQESLRDLLDKQKDIENKLEQLSDFKRESETRNEQFRESDERIKEKQDELQRIFEEVLSEDLKDLFEKIREELDKMDRNELYDMLSRMEFEFRDLETQMDRALELFKQLEMERMLQESIDMLAEIREEQEKLADESIADSDAENLAEQQKELQEEFEQLMDMLDDFREKNEQLTRPNQLDDTSDLEESVQESMESAGEQLENNEKQDANQQQRDAMQGMQQLSDRLQNMQQDMFMEQLAEDARALRQILENLLKSSFSQEDLLMEIRQVNVNDPRYVEFIQDQRKIKDDLNMIEDSLIALSKRQVQIQSYVTREIAEIGLNIGQAINHMIERQRGQASSRQQFVMTHINNLALLLNESMQEMQSQLGGSGGEGMPQTGEGGEQSFRNMRQMQEQLNQMLQQMQEGHQPMPGESGEQPMSMSEAMARMAAEQEAIRKELQKLGDKLREDGMGEMIQDLSEIERDMERTELDMVRKDISRQTLLRQEEILTRLLEHERAEMEREMEERRVGNTAYNYDISNPEAIFEYNRIRNRELEMLRSLPAGLKPFYKTIVENYFLNVQD